MGRNSLGFDSSAHFFLPSRNVKLSSCTRNKVHVIRSWLVMSFMLLDKIIWPNQTSPTPGILVPIYWVKRNKYSFSKVPNLGLCQSAASSHYLPWLQMTLRITPSQKDCWEVGGSLEVLYQPSLNQASP